MALLLLQSDHIKIWRTLAENYVLEQNVLKESTLKVCVNIHKMSIFYFVISRNEILEYFNEEFYVSLGHSRRTGQQIPFRVSTEF